MHVVVIGGAGYIGSHVTRRLLDARHRVTVFDNLSTGLRENLFADGGFVHGDIMRPLQLRAALGSADAVVHLAAAKAAGESMLVPEKYAEQNIAGTINVLNAMIATGVKSVVFSSSAAVYGEPRYLPIDEKHPTEPINFYGFTKLEIERILGWYDSLKGVRSARLRYFNAAGYDPDGRVPGLERDPANLLPLIMEVATGARAGLKLFGNDYDTRDGTCIRDYIHVTDLANAHLQALEWITGNDRSLTVNLGSEAGVTVTEMIEAARRITGEPVPTEIVDRRPGDPAELVASAAEARRVLGWETEHSDVDSLVATSWAAYRAAAT
ncbi:MAG: UDP-glucose 4-epimerase GalE [Spirochaetales bacterium]|nr:UDP-glucose 4-epimerase GalE [Spirochaetales bacterium]